MNVYEDNLFLLEDNKVSRVNKSLFETILERKGTAGHGTGLDFCAECSDSTLTGPPL